jgi:L-aspartate oxidase
VHGANRLASNSLLEGLVFAERVGQDIKQIIQSRRGTTTSDVCLPDTRSTFRPTPTDNNAISQIRDIMWAHVGLMRTESGLIEALGQLHELAMGGAVRTSRGQNMLTVAQLIAMAALAREESRGAHFRADHPEPAETWARSSVWTLKALEAKIHHVLHQTLAV